MFFLPPGAKEGEGVAGGTSFEATAGATYVCGAEAAGTNSSSATDPAYADCGAAGSEETAGTNEAKAEVTSTG